jgi:hypothetical protein
MTTDSLRGEAWLLAYESNIKGWFQPSADYVAGDPFFDALRSAGVSFYRQIKPTSFTMNLAPMQPAGDVSTSQSLWYS